MAERRASSLQFDALLIEGALLLPDVVAKVASGDAGGTTPDSYGVLPGLKLRDEIGRFYQVGRALWQRFELGKQGKNADLAYRQFAKDVLVNVLGFRFDGLKTKISSKSYDLLSAKNGRVPIAIAGSEGLDKAETGADAGGVSVRRSPTTAVQGELNASNHALWGIATDGARVRILRDSASLTRPALIEFDLDRIFRTDLYADFTLFWLLSHESRFGSEDTPPSDCALEAWREIGREQGVAVRGRLRNSVEEALFELGGGVLEHPGNGPLRDRLLANGADVLSKDDFFRQLLRLVYRLIFVMTAEDRDILFLPDATEASKDAYSTGYSLARLRERARVKAAWDRHHDTFEGVKVVFKALASGQRRLGLPALGGLFESTQTPDLDLATISNKRFLTALFHLAWLREPAGLVRINWRDMATEEFGSVYESLLELTPIVSDDARAFFFRNGVGDPRGDNKKKGAVQGNKRKKTGSYYTPDGLVELLLDITLDPEIERRVAQNPGNPDALLKLTAIDPACGSGHFILGAARRIARRLADLRNPGAASIAEYRHALREVVGHCIYGVDRNDMAVELCRVALWIEAVEPGRPLSFIESRIRTGDSLIGVFDLGTLSSGIPDEAYKRLTGDDKTVCSHLRNLNKKQRDGAERQQRLAFTGPPAELTEAWSRIESISDDNLESVRRKGEAYSKLRATEAWTNLKTACDIWTASFFARKAGIPTSGEANTVPLTDHVWLACQGTALPPALISAVGTLARQAHFFHWQLEFPDIFERGGFDVVLGNPPWEVSEFDEIEFFSSRAPDIAGLAGSDRKAAIAALQSESSGLWEEYEIQKRLSDAVNEFYRASGRFPLTARGKANTYALFSEHFARLAALLQPEGGRQRPGASSNRSAGIIVPTGLATDDSTSDFFGALIKQHCLRKLISFYEVRAWFPATDDRNPFALVSMGSSSEDPVMVFDAKTVVDANDSRKAFRLSASDLKLFNPNTETAPTFRSEHDAALTRRIYRTVPILNDRSTSLNPWGVSFKQGLFNMTSDSGLFRTGAQLAAAGGVRRGPEWHLSESGGSTNCRSGTWVPLIEGKTIDHYDHRYGTYAGFGARPTYSASLPAPTEVQRQDPTFEIDPWYWVHSDDVEKQLSETGWSRGWLCGFRDVTKALNERTVILSCMPKWAVGHTLPILFCDPAKVPIAVLIGGLSSLPFDYFARQKLNGPHLTFTYLRQFPFPPPDRFDELERNFVTSRVIELTYTSDRMKPFADDMGYSGKPFAWNENRRALLKAELDAFFALKFDLSVEDLQYVLDPRRLMGDGYPSETFRVLRTNEVAQHGEYRTERLVLDAFNRLKDGRAAASELSNSDVTQLTSAVSREEVGDLPDLAWERPGDSADAMLTQLAAMIAALPGPTPIEKVVLATIYAWKPTYLAKRLSGQHLSDWTRLTGDSGVSPTSGVVFFTPKTDVAFRNAVVQLRGMRALLEDEVASTWRPGPGLSKFEIDKGSWASGRARFALTALSGMEVAKAVSFLSDHDIEWVRNAHAA